MYIVKNAFLNMTRNRGKNLLIGLIFTIITICTCVALSIYKAGNNLVATYKKSNPLAISFNLDMSSLRNASDDEKEAFTSLTTDSIISYGDSRLVKDYYYTLETSLSSNQIEALDENIRSSKPDGENETSENNVRDNHRGAMSESMGDFRITAYSNFAYLSDFSEGTKKIIEGTMISGASAENEIVISKDLADENNLKLDDEITFILPSNEEETFTFKVIGIYEESATGDASNFLQATALNSANQLYTNLTSVEEILQKTGNDETKFVASNGLSAKFYLNDDEQLEIFEKEVREKGLSTYYILTTNETEILTTLKPIQNIAAFSVNFLWVILVVGSAILIVINVLNIRDRKYEIGILRAIGMNKWKVTSQLVLEIFFVALASFIIGSSMGFIASQPITNKMLESEITSYTEKVDNTSRNFGGEGFEKPANNRSKMPAKTTYVDSLKVKIEPLTILQLLAISILLTILSGSIACLFVNQYNPNKILQNRV